MAFKRLDCLLLSSWFLPLSQPSHDRVWEPIGFGEHLWGGPETKSGNKNFHFGKCWFYFLPNFLASVLWNISLHFLRALILQDSKQAKKKHTFLSVTARFPPFFFVATDSWGNFQGKAPFLPMPPFGLWRRSPPWFLETFWACFAVTTPGFFPGKLPTLKIRMQWHKPFAKKQENIWHNECVQMSFCWNSWYETESKRTKNLDQNH